MLQISNLTARPAHSAPNVLKGVSLNAHDGEILVLLGASGTGKSTLLRCIAGLTEPVQGEITIDSQSVLHLPPARRDLSYLVQSGGCYDHWTVRKHLQEDFRLQTATNILQSIDQILDTTELTLLQHFYPHQLSGGQLQRLAIARAVAAGRRTILMDEPLVHLDAQSKQPLLQLIQNMRQAQRSIVYVTHDRCDAMLLADHIALLHSGTIIQSGPPEDLYRFPSSIAAAMLLGDLPMQFFNARQSHDSVELFYNDQCVARKAISEIQAHSTSVRKFSDELTGTQTISIESSKQKHPSEFLIGVRPEAIKVFPQSHTSDLSGNKIQFAAQLSGIRRLGSSIQYTLGLKGQSTNEISILRFSPIENTKVGDRVICAFELNQCSFFDPETKLAVSLNSLL